MKETEAAVVPIVVIDATTIEAIIRNISATAVVPTVDIDATTIEAIIRNITTMGKIKPS